MNKLPKTIIISGTGRNVGKTTLCCRLIEEYKRDNPIGIKISPHKHSIQENEIVLLQTNEITILQEKDKTSPKDSSRMLAAGADRVYFIMAEDKYIIDALEFLQNHIKFTDRIIIESATLRRYFEPELFLIVSNTEFPDSKPKNTDLDKFADYRLSFDGHDFYNILNQQGYFMTKG
jgi:Ni2+-binding GTPase involved in maturation of urease and hydrogenase